MAVRGSGGGGGASPGGGRTGGRGHRIGGGCRPRSPDVLDALPVPLWEADLSAVRQRLEELKPRAGGDLRSYLSLRPEETLALMGAVRVTRANEAVLRLYGVRDTEEFAARLVFVVGKDSYEFFTKAFLSLASGEAECRSEPLKVTVGGATKALLVHLGIGDDDGDALTRVYVVATDVTRSKRALDDVSARVERYRGAFHAAQVPLVLVDGRTGIVVEANDCARRLLGWRTEALSGMPLSDLCSDQDREPCEEAFRRITRGKRSVSSHLSLRCSDGSLRRVLATGLPIDEQRGSLVSFTLVPMGADTPLIERRETQDRRSDPAGPRRLSEREREILLLIAQGQTNREIAARLFISQKTVETHRMRIMQKLGVRKATELVRRAFGAGLLE